MRKNNTQNRISNVPTSSNNNKKDKNFSKVNNGVFVYTKSLSVGELADQLNLKSAEIIKFLFMQKKMVTQNQVLDDDTIGEICLEFGYDVKKEKVVADENFEELEIVDDEKDLVERPPVITVMGHVDHGKTTLIDAIRSSNLADNEFGGISQAIGAYQKEVKGRKITFIDTPGHEAFTAMRSRGASITDIVVLVVAADDGVMPQTIEAIDHAKAAKAPIIVAVNKIDKLGATPDRVKEELLAHNIVAEEYGGDVIFVHISAKQKTGIDELLENIITLAEIMELKANPNRYAIGTVLEAHLDKGEGPKASLLIKNGTLNNSDFVVVGSSYGRIRRMTNEHKQVLKTAPPATPVSISGLDKVPNAGDVFMAFNNEKQAKEIAEKRRLNEIDAAKSSSGPVSLDDLFNANSSEEVQELKLIIRADSTGSCEALKSSLEKVATDKIKINVIRATAGAITESDVLLASASGAIIYGFNVRPDAQVRAKAAEEKIEIRLHRIIYALIEEIQAAMKGMLKAELVEEVLGQAEVRKLIKVSKIGTICGSYVTEGVIRNKSKMRLLRDGVIIYEGEIASIKRFQDDAKEVKQGFECGILLANYHDEHEGDIIECYHIVEKK